LPSAGLTLGKVTIPLSSVNTRQIFFLKKINLYLSARRQVTRQIFFKKKINLCRVSDAKALDKDFFKKQIKNLCQVLSRHSAKGAVRLTANVTFAECPRGIR